MKQFGHALILALFAVLPTSVLARDPGIYRFQDWAFHYKTDQFQNMCHLITETDTRPDDDPNKREPLSLRLSMTDYGAPFGADFRPFEDWYVRRPAFVIFANGPQKMNSGFDHVSPGFFVKEFVSGLTSSLSSGQVELQLQTMTGDVEASYVFSLAGFLAANATLLDTCGTQEGWGAPFFN